MLPRPAFALLLTTLSCLVPIFGQTGSDEPPRLSEDKIASLLQRFAGVKQWEITYHFESDNPHEWVEGGRQHHRAQWREASHGSFVVPTEYSQDGVLRLEGRGPSFDEISIDQQSALNVYRTNRYDRGAGATTCHVDFTLSFETGIYEASFSPRSEGRKVLTPCKFALEREGNTAVIPPSRRPLQLPVAPTDAAHAYPDRRKRTPPPRIPRSALSHSPPRS